MRKDLNISCNLNHFCYHNESYDWTTEMPYFWFSFFKIDGSNCKLNEALQLEGNATIYSKFKKIESLTSLEPDKQDVLKIPSKIGREEMTLKPIPVPDFVNKNKIDNLESYVGCIAVLMNEECALNDEKNLYSKILNQIIQNSLNDLIPHLTENQSTINKNLHDLKDKIELKLNEESKKNQSFWKRLTTENIIETTIWTFSSDELKALHSVSLAKYWGNEGLWELSGKVKVAEKISKYKINPEAKSRKNQSLILH